MGKPDKTSSQASAEVWAGFFWCRFQDLCVRSAAPFCTPLQAVYSKRGFLFFPRGVDRIYEFRVEKRKKQAFSSLCVSASHVLLNRSSSSFQNILAEASANRRGRKIYAFIICSVDPHTLSWVITHLPLMFAAAGRNSPQLEKKINVDSDKAEPFPHPTPPPPPSSVDAK